MPHQAKPLQSNRSPLLRLMMAILIVAWTAVATPLAAQVSHSSFVITGVGEAHSHGRVADLAADEHGNVYVVGTLGGLVDLDRDGSAEVGRPGREAMFVAKYDVSLNLVWSTVLDGPDSSGRALALHRASGPGLIDPDELYKVWVTGRVRRNGHLPGTGPRPRDESHLRTRQSGAQIQPGRCARSLERPHQQRQRVLWPPPTSRLTGSAGRRSAASFGTGIDYTADGSIDLDADDDETIEGMVIWYDSLARVRSLGRLNADDPRLPLEHRTEHACGSA